MKYNILAVDDQEINLSIIDETLTTQGFSVSLASCGQECLQMVGRLMPDLILLDVMMPDMDGFAVCQKLKDDPHTAKIPVIFITALGDQESILRGYAVGGADYISKPFDRAVMTARVKAILTMQKLGKDREVLLKASQAMIKRMEQILIDVSLHTKLDMIKKDVGDVAEDIFAKIERMRSKIKSSEILGFLDQIEMTLQFFDRLSQQINEVAKTIGRLHSIIQGDEKRKPDTASQSSASVLMAKFDQGEVDSLLESLGL